MGRRFVAAVLGGVSLVAAACGSFGSSEDGTSRDDAGAADGATADGTTADVAVDAPGTGADGASDGAMDAGPVNLNQNGTFEAMGCAGWNPVNATKEVVKDGRGGGSACMFCSSANASWEAYGLVMVPPVVGVTYSGRAYVRTPPTAPDSGPPNITTRFQVNQGGTTVQQSPPELGPTVTAQWTRIDHVYRVSPDGGDKLELVVGVGGPGGCFLLDDVVVEALPP